MLKRFLSTGRSFSSNGCSEHFFKGKGLQRIKCLQCGYLAKPDQQHTPSYFDLLGEPPCFNLDLAKLKARFLEAQKTLHPDQANGNKEAREHWSALYNRAWECLKDPLCRSTLLYNQQCGGNQGLEGEEVVVESNAQAIAANEDADDELLDQVLEARMALEEAEAAADVQAVQAANEERIVETVADLDAAFAVNNLERVRDLIIRLRYWYSLRAACHNHPLQ